MGYKLSYDSVKLPKTAGKTDKKAWFYVALVVACFFGAVAVKAYGLRFVQEILLPGDPEVTEAALEGMIARLKTGTSLSQAFEAFCREIVAYGTALT